MLVISINSYNNIRQYNVMYTNIHVKQLLRAYRCFSCYRNRNYEANPQGHDILPLLGKYSLTLTLIGSCILLDIQYYQ